MFYFRLSPIQWKFDEDGDTIFRALELSDGSYLISWKSKDNATIEVPYTSEEVTEEIAKQHWILEV